MQFAHVQAIAETTREGEAVPLIGTLVAESLTRRLTGVEIGRTIGRPRGRRHIGRRVRANDVGHGRGGVTRSGHGRSVVGRFAIRQADVWSNP
jgi:hypothetical protein